LDKLPVLHRVKQLWILAWRSIAAEGNNPGKTIVDHEGWPLRPPQNAADARSKLE